jgi:hypothetical protein
MTLWGAGKLGGLITLAHMYYNESMNRQLVFHGITQDSISRVKMLFVGEGMRPKCERDAC